MKKIFSLLLTFVCLIVLSGCDNEEIITCSQKKDGYTETYTWVASDDKIKEAYLTIDYDNSIFGVDSLTVLGDSQKEQVRKNMLATLGLEDKEYDGMEIEVIIEDTMTVKVNADLSKAETNILRKVGLDYSENNMSLKSATEYYKSVGANCK